MLLIKDLSEDQAKLFAEFQKRRSESAKEKLMKFLDEKSNGKCFGDCVTELCATIVILLGRFQLEVTRHEMNPYKITEEFMNVLITLNKENEQSMRSFEEFIKDKKVGMC